MVDRLGKEAFCTLGGAEELVELCAESLPIQSGGGGFHASGQSMNDFNHAFELAQVWPKEKRPRERRSRL